MAFGAKTHIKHRENSSGRLVVLSDLHIWGTSDPLHRGFINFLHEKLKEGDTLFLVGDVFDLFIGNKQIFVDKYSELIKTLETVSKEKNIQIYYTEGNHDFYLKPLFHSNKKITVLNEDYEYSWHGRTLLFSHGDKVNPSDYGYRVYKACLQSVFMRSVIKAVPGSVIDKIGSSMSATSRQYHPNASDETVRMFRNYACEHISGGVDFVVLGHSHFIDDIKFKVDDHEGQYINIGFPRRDMMYASIEPQDQFFTFHSWCDNIAPHKL